MLHAYGSRFFRIVVSLLEWILKKLRGPDGWRPAGAILALPPSALVYDAREAARAEGVFRILSDLGFAPTRVAVSASSGDAAELCRSISRGASGCWATVVLEPDDETSARSLGPAFRRYAHRHQDVVAMVVGPLPSRAEILDRYLHVVTAEDGSVASPDLAAGIAHACVARVIHCARLLNAAVVFFSILALVFGIGMALLGWGLAQR
jgi:hypothetical protein